MEDTLHTEELLELLNSLQSSLALAPLFTPTDNTSTPQDYSNCAVVPDLAPALSPQDQDDLDDIEHIIDCNLDEQQLNKEQFMSPQSCSVVPNVDTNEELSFLDYDPMFWDNATVKRWIMQKCEEHGIQDVQLDRFNMTGQQLCNMTLANFDELCNDNGDLLYLALEMMLGFGQNYDGGVSMYDLGQRGLFSSNNNRVYPNNEEYNMPTPPPNVMENNYYQMQYPVSPMSGTSTERSSETQSISEPSDDEWMPPSNSPAPHKPPKSPKRKGSSDKVPKAKHSKRGRPRSDGRIPSPNRGNRSVHLYEFLYDLLEDDDYCPAYITWTHREQGIFRLVNSSAVAKLWGKRKNRANMNYEKMSRALRYYYDRNILERMGQRLVYKFSDEVCHVLGQKCK